MHKPFCNLFCRVLFAAAFILGALGVPTLRANANAADITQHLDPTTRHGGWLDTINMSVVPGEDAIQQLEDGVIDIYGTNMYYSFSLEEIQTAGLEFSEQYGKYDEITFNPILWFDNGKLNPFGSPRIREAMNLLIDRNYISNALLPRPTYPMWTALPPGFPEYLRYVDLVRPLEAEYSPNLALADQIITAEMESLGAEEVDGIWCYRYDGLNPEPITLTFLIRVEDERTMIGDYVADQLEAIGFVVDRQYKTRLEAGQIWQGNPRPGAWNLYTGGWVTNVISRDDAGAFGSYYTPLRGGGALWEAYTPSPEFYAVAEQLWINDIDSMETRRTLFEQALDLSLEDSARVWVIETSSYSPWRPELEVSSDRASGIGPHRMWPFTLRYTGQEGGEVDWAADGLLAAEINPINGSNWFYDTQWQFATSDSSTITNPSNGLPMAQRLEHADVYIVSGRPVTKTYDWVDLHFVDSIEVPADAWLDWDPVAENWLTVGDLHPQGLSAVRKVVITYPEGMFEAITWHDGSPLSVADFLMLWVEKFAVGTPGSPLYDDDMDFEFQGFKWGFRGIRFTSMDPLTIEYYADDWYLDAELNVPETWPNYGYGEAAWHVVAVGNEAVMAGELAYTGWEEGEPPIPMMNFVRDQNNPERLDPLVDHLNLVAATGLVPFPNVLGPYITAGEAADRYANLQAWYAAHDHFWVGTGPYYLDTAFYDTMYTSSLVLRQNANYVDLSDRWAAFSQPTDTDQDGVPDGIDNAPFIFNPDQRNVDGDQFADVIDPCPSDPANTCDPTHSGAQSIGSAGGIVTTGEGNLTLTIPAGALSEPTSLSITDTGSGFEIATDHGVLIVADSATLQPHGTIFDTPVTVTFEWHDADDDGIVDGTALPEERLVVSKNGIVIAGPCINTSSCDMEANTFAVQLTSLSEFALGVLEAPQLTALGPVKTLIGVKSGNNVGVNFDLLAEVYYGDELIGSGQLDGAPGGRTGFNGARWNTIPLTLFGPVSMAEGIPLRLKLYVRNTCYGNTLARGAARLWYNDAAADSGFSVTIGEETIAYFLRESFGLDDFPGLERQSISVDVGQPCGPFVPFGTWSLTP